MNIFHLATFKFFVTLKIHHKCSCDLLLVVYKPAVYLTQSRRKRLSWHLGNCPLQGICHFRVSLCFCFKTSHRANNLSRESEFDLHEIEPVGRSHFHTNNLAWRLVLTQRHMETTDWLPGKRSDRDTAGVICAGWGTGLLIAGLLVIWLSNKFTALAGTVLLLISKL